MKLLGRVAACCKYEVSMTCADSKRNANEYRSSKVKKLNTSVSTQKHTDQYGFTNEKPPCFSQSPERSLIVKKLKVAYALRGLSTQMQEILDQLFSLHRQHAFGMELHAFHGELPVAQAHDGAGTVFLAGPGADFQLFR